MSAIEITGRHLNDFEQHGFVIVKDPFIAAFKDRITADLARIAREIISRFPEFSGKDLNGFTLQQLVDFANGRERDQRATRALYELFPNTPVLWSLVSEPLFVEACKAFGIAEPMVWTVPIIRIDRPNLSQFLSPPHQDYWSSFLSPNGIVFWIPLVELTPEIGFIEIIPNSHTKGCLPVSVSKDGSWNCELRNQFPDNRFVKVQVAYDEMVVFGPYLVHRSGENLSDKNVRMTLQIRFNDLKTMPTMAPAYATKTSDYVISEIKERTGPNGI